MSTFEFISKRNVSKRNKNIDFLGTAETSFLSEAKRGDKSASQSMTLLLLQLQLPAHICQSSLQVLNVCQKQKGEEIILGHSIVQCDK